jgi:ADP-ribose pyrophosphatase YjhB (NUDIX family)
MAAPRTPKPSGVLDPDFTFAVPDGDDRQRRICGHCGFVDYDNPRIVVGSVVRHEGRILLCRRAINPRKGFWTLPAGYLETGETPAEGAAREAREEANAALTLSGVLAIYTIRRLGQVQIMHRAILAEPAIFAGAESLEVGLFAWKIFPGRSWRFPPLSGRSITIWRSSRTARPCRFSIRQAKTVIWNISWKKPAGKAENCCFPGKPPPGGRRLKTISNTI